MFTQFLFEPLPKKTTIGFTDSPYDRNKGQMENEAFSALADGRDCKIYIPDLSHHSVF